MSALNTKETRLKKLRAHLHPKTYTSPPTSPPKSPNTTLTKPKTLRDLLDELSDSEDDSPGDMLESTPSITLPHSRIVSSSSLKLMHNPLFENEDTGAGTDSDTLGYIDFTHAVPPPVRGAFAFSPTPSTPSPKASPPEKRGPRRSAIDITGKTNSMTRMMPIPRSSEDDADPQNPGYVLVNPFGDAAHELLTRPTARSTPCSAAHKRPSFRFWTALLGKRPSPPVVPPRPHSVTPLASRSVHVTGDDAGKKGHSSFMEENFHFF